VSTQNDVAVLERLFPQVLRGFGLAHRELGVAHAMIKAETAMGKTPAIARPALVTGCAERA
jgi:hypothetical protein